VLELGGEVSAVGQAGLAASLSTTPADRDDLHLEAVAAPLLVETPLGKSVTFGSLGHADQPMSAEIHRRERNARLEPDIGPPIVTSVGSTIQ